MKKNNNRLIQPHLQPGKEVKVIPDGYPTYPASEDIYSKSIHEANINPEDITQEKLSGVKEEAGAGNEKDFEEDVSGSDLDIPGAELDDREENIGSGDEENNHYSVGGDNHNNLEENQGE